MCAFVTPVVEHWLEREIVEMCAFVTPVVEHWLEREIVKCMPPTAYCGEVDV